VNFLHAQRSVGGTPTAATETVALPGKSLTIRADDTDKNFFIRVIREIRG